MKRFEIKGELKGTYDENWKSSDMYWCVPGNAQMALVWLKLYRATRDARFLNVALKMNDQLKSIQEISFPHRGIRGGIRGSWPIFGDYSRMNIVSWGAKFFADSLMLEEEIMKKYQDI